LAFADADAIKGIEHFIKFLWSGPRAPARTYVQESGLPLILPMASDGTYNAAMSSVDDMNGFVDYLIQQSDDASNMDW
jgi:hypothetical protein